MSAVRETNEVLRNIACGSPQLHIAGWACRRAKGGVSVGIIILMPSAGDRLLLIIDSHTILDNVNSVPIVNNSWFTNKAESAMVEVALLYN